MSVVIFENCLGRRLRRLMVNHDGSVTYHEESVGDDSANGGNHAQDRTMSLDEAQQDWPPYADEILKAVQFVRKVTP